MKTLRPSDHPSHSTISGSRPPRKTQAAFTLIELLAIMVIITLVAAFTVPELISTSSARKVEQAQNMVAGAMDNARLMAIADGQTRVFFVPTTNDPVLVNHLGGVEPGLQTFAVLQSDGANWSLIGEWKQLPEGVAFNNFDAFDENHAQTLAGTPGNPMADNDGQDVPLDVDSDDVPEPLVGAILEFHADGTASRKRLDGSDIEVDFWVVAVSDALVTGGNTFQAKNANLERYIAIESQSGSITTPQ